MVTTIIVLAVIAAILLIIVILIQNPKGGGLSSEFGGSGTSQMFGVQRTGDIVTKLTWGFFIFIVVASLGILVFLKSSTKRQLNAIDVNVETATSAPEVPALPTPTQTLPVVPESDE